MSRLKIFPLFISLLVALLFVASVGAEDFPFSDAEQHGYQEAIVFMYEEGTISGYDDGTFRPQNLINRAEFVKMMVYSAIEAEEIYVEALPSDVEAGVWFAAPVSTALRYEIISGYPDGTFQGGNFITFVEAAKVIVRAFDLEFEEDAEAPWYEGYVLALEGAGAIPETIHYLDHEVTRGDVSEILYRLQAGIADREITSYDTLVENTAEAGEAFVYWEEGAAYGVTMDAQRVHMNVLTGQDSIRQTECDFPHHCVAEVQAESFSSFWARSHGRFLVNGAFFDAYSLDLNGENYHETGGDLILNGGMESMFGWDEAFGDGGMLAQMNDGRYEFFYPIRDWLEVQTEIQFAISNYPLVLNQGDVIDEASHGLGEADDSKFWTDSRRAGLGLSGDGETILYVSVVGDVTDLGEVMRDRGAEWGFQLDAGASLGFAYEGETIVAPSRSIVTAVEFY